MKYQIKTGAPEKQRSQCVVAGIFSKGKLSEAAATLDSASGGRLKALLKAGALQGDRGQTRLLFDVKGIAAKSVLLVGLGDEEQYGHRAYREAVQAAVKALDEGGIKDALFLTTMEFPSEEDALYWGVRHLVEAADYAAYRFDTTVSQKAPAGSLKSVDAWYQGRGGKAAAEKGLHHGQGVAEGTALARELGDLPANVCTPSHLANQARKLARNDKQFKTTILNEADCKKLGMGSFLSVAKGSDEPCKFIVMEYKNTKGKTRPHVLVGKGLTFDTGGISLKPAPGMDEMKYDMCGGASVFGTLAAVSNMQLPTHVVGIVPATENHINGKANKPGDVVTSLSGQTIEILNTDAEGRLILNDALTYAKRYKPQSLIDIATLTGACVIALGQHASGLMSKDDELAEDILAAGNKAWDRAWRLPLWDEYQDQLKSKFADMANVGGKEAGSVTAGCFLSRYTEGQRWAHIDVAGSAWISGNGPQKGATGRPVPLLTQYLIDQN
ncbi:leucyl aminopeptidase [Natronospira proteinivora]|uniref:Probable cytosol aminopeptidase n=1 Tax=Natronospira proteinivora TaxID=1807133 RepID=A0ABT1G525_9GAMM|nr:leucyl aminopeptidase [Natronospira proteinivora]MCP1726192.1 leucyl aminopeptidase [Natronospira proteinivora]